MNNPSPAQAPLAAAARQRDRSARAATALAGAGLALLALLAAASLDYWLTLPAKVRWAGFAIVAGLVVAGALRLVGLLRRPTTLKQAALAVEQRRPDAGCEVSTAAEYLTGERQATQDYERELAAALQQRAAEAVSRNPVNFTRRLLAPALGAGAALVLLAVFAVSFPAAGTALKRTAAPWSKAAFSRIEVKPGNTEVAVGKPFELAAAFHGRLPASATLQFRGEGQSAWTDVALTGATNGTFRHTLPAVSASFAYRVTGSDAVSDEFTVTAFVPPAVKDLRVKLEPPAYTRLPVTEQAAADIAIVRGTKATFRVAPNVDLSKARLAFTNGTVTELKRDPQGLWTAEVPVTKDNEFRFELFDAKGRKGGDELAHRLTAIPDAAPKVDFELPGGDIRAAATNRVPLKLAASDDFGLGAMKIVFHRLGGPEQELPIAKWTTQDKESVAEVELDLTPLKLRQFELVAYHAEVRDNNTLDGPGVGRSPTYFIEITDLEGGKCLSQKQGQKVNLLTIQKQIIADTATLAAASPKEKFDELALRQRDAIEFGKLYQQGLSETGAPLPVQGAMNAAVAAMTQAAGTLEKSQRDAALPPEETALARLYEVLKLMPVLKDLPTQLPPMAQEKEAQPQPPPAVKVVLEALKKQKKEDPKQQELAKMLEQIQQLARQQAAISSACENPGSSPAGASATEPSRSAQAQNPQEPKAGQNQTAKSNPAKAGQAPGKQPGKQSGKGQGEGQPKDELAKNDAEAKDSPKPGEKPGQKPGEGKKPGDDQPKSTAELAKLAPKQEAMSQEAKALAERLARLMGKGSRTGKAAGQQLSEASAKMSEAAQAMRSGNGSGAGSKGNESNSALGNATAMVEALLAGRPEVGDIASEDAPKQYEGALADYFKRLSRAE
jgi:hypothetical protein